ncbi:unnamed protein product [Alopecurus aequalis]
MNLNRVSGRRPDLMNVDRQIELPDDVLLNILDRLDTVDAVRTCIASKQTLRLLNMLSQIGIVLPAQKLVRKNGLVANLTNRILSTRSPQIPIRNLKLKFIMRGDDHLKIGRSVALAMATQKVEAVEFQILTNKCFHNYTRAATEKLCYAQQFNDFIRKCPDAFGGLTGLHLQNMRFAESDILNILSTCKRLESLRLILCDSGNHSVLQVQHSQLVELDITDGYFSKVELNYLPELQRMSYTRWHFLWNPLVLGFVPGLSNLRLANAYDASEYTVKISQLLVNVPTISNLHLDFQCEKVWLHQESRKLLAPLLDKLRFVNLDNIPRKSGITWTLSFIEAAPSLEELCITISDHKCHTDSRQDYSKKKDVKWEQSVADFEHKNLAKLTIHGFESDDTFMRYVRSVMEVAVNIREVSLHDRKVCKLCSNICIPSRYPRTSEEEDIPVVSKRITEALVTASPAVIKFRPSSYYSPLEIEYYT